MKKWTKLLPFFVVAWLARKHCERFAIPTVGLCVQPYKGVLIEAKP